MNNCTFYGVVENELILEKDAGVSFVDFTLAVYNYRRTSSGEKVREVTYIPCQAWASGAETLVKKAKPGSRLLVQCSVKSIELDHDSIDIVFRVNEFEIMERQ